MISGWSRFLILFVLSGILAAACTGTSPHLTSTPQSIAAARTTAVKQASKTATLTLKVTATLAPSITPTNSLTPTQMPTVTPTFDPSAWENLPVIPSISNSVKTIFAKGQSLGNDPHAFSKIGDCETAALWFLGDFDSNPPQYSLGPYTGLQSVIRQFPGSYKRLSLAARIGFNAASVLNPIWADPKQCQADESPLICEYRNLHPSYAFILLGTNDVSRAASFETDMRTIIEFLIDHGVIPILATKADNREGDQSINITIARLAYEYNIPLWNFWLAVQPLPKAGLQEDLAHLTWAPNDFSNPFNMTSGWAVRNLTALQVLNAVWMAASSP